MSKLLKVLIVGPYPKEEGNRFGGVEVHTSYLTDGLARHEGVDVHVLTAANGGPRAWRTRTGVQIREVAQFRRLQFVTDGFVNVPRFRRALREIDPDIVHVHTTTLYARAAVEVGYPTLLTVHGIMYGEAALHKGLQSRLQFGYRCKCERDAIHRAKHILCLNNYALEAIQPYLNGAETRLIDNGVDDRFFSLPALQEQGRVFFGGMIMERKNLLGLLEAARLIVDRRTPVKLRIAGGVVEPEYYQTCLDFVEANRLQASVDFLGNISVDQMLDEMARANMLVLPAKQETSPMIISEAMAAARPVVATAAGGIAEVVKDGVTGFIVPFDDSKVLADRIDQLLTDAQLREKLGAQARELAVQRFDRAAVIERTLQYYRDIVHEEGR